MIVEDDDEVVRRMLEGLAAVDAMRERTERIRRRGHAILARRLVLSGAARRAAPWWRAALEPALVASLGVVFLFEVARRALWVWGT